MKRKVPTLDFADYQNKATEHKFIKDFYEGLKDYGFVVLKNHPVSNKLIKEVYQQMESFFVQEFEEKSKYMDNKNIVKQSGFIPFGTEHAKDKSPSLFDLKEFWQVLREFEGNKQAKTLIPDNIWTEDEKFNQRLKDLYQSFDDLAKILLKALSVPLKIDSTYFDDLIDEGNSVLRVIHYPPIDGLDVSGKVRAAAHEDINLITIMPGASETGLEILDRDGEWLSVEANYDYLIVDSGDMLSRITNDILPATTHRVINPKDPKTRRFSMPFFVHPNPDAILKCIDSCLDVKKYPDSGAKYPPIRSIDLLNERLKAIGLVKDKK